MVRLPHVAGAAHQRSEDLVIVLAAAQVPRNTVRQFGSRGVWVCFEEPNRGHDKSRHTKGTLESLFVDDALLDRMQRSVRICQPLDGQDLLVTHSVGDQKVLSIEGLANP